MPAPIPRESGQIIVYKILSGQDWDAAVSAGIYTGSADDARDGFIHFSAADQLAGTAAKYFKGQLGLVVVAIDTARLDPLLRWEPSRGGALFPHLYGALDVAAAIRVTPAPLDVDGIPILPKDIA